MPTISKIRFTNVVYEGGNKRYTDETFHFQGENSAIVLENGGGKTVFIQAAIQAILPHETLANRKIKETLNFDDGPAHIAIEWIMNDRPRRYALTAVTIFPYQNSIDSLRYVYEYGPNDPERIENIPFTYPLDNGEIRIASHGEMKEYMSKMSQNGMGKTFPTISSFTQYIEKNLHIISNEWKSIVKINSAEGGVEAFFDACPTEKSLYEQLLIPTVEKSLVAFDDKQFADIFETQRTKFRKYKQLKEQLLEYESVQKRLQDYVECFEKLHENQQSFEEQKMRAKVFHQMIGVEISATEEKLNKLTEDQTTLQETMNEHLLKEKSFEIATIQQQLNENNAIKQQLEDSIEELKEQLDQQQLEVANIKYARTKWNMKESQNKQANLEEQLKRLDEQISNTELQQQLIKVKQAISGNYQETKERFEKIVADYEQQLNVLGRNYNEQEKVWKKAEAALGQAKEAVLLKNENIKFIQNQMTDLASTIITNKMEDVTSLRIEQASEAQRLDDKIIELKSNIKQLKVSLLPKKEQLAHEQHREKTLLSEQSIINEKLKQIELAQQDMQQIISDKLPSVTRIQNLFLNEQSITHQVEAIVERKQKDYNEKLHIERLTLRHVDDYGDQKSFFADSYVAKQLENWKNQFAFLETAIAYFQGEPVDHLDGALLAITLVTNEEEIPLLKEKLQQSADYLTYPIQIWSLQEATSIANKELEPMIQLLEPNYWKNHSQIDTFKAWQEEVQRKAQAATNERKMVEHEWAVARQVQQQLLQFYVSFTLENLQQLQSERQEISGGIFHCQQAIKECNLQIKEIEETIEQQDEQVKMNEGKKLVVEKKLEKLLEYEKLQRQEKELQEELVYLDESYQFATKEWNKEKRQLDSLAHQLKQVKEEFNEEKSNQRSYFDQRPLYRQVEQWSPIFTEESYEQLQQKHEMITKEIDGITHGRSLLEVAIEDEKTRQQQFATELTILNGESPLIEETFALPLNAVDRLSQLAATIQKTKEIYKEVDIELNNVKTKSIQLDTLKSAKLNEIERVIQFDQPLMIVRTKLNDEKKLLKLRQQQLEKQLGQHQHILKELSLLHQQLLIADGSYGFLAPHIEAAALKVEEQTDFQYQREAFINQTIQQLKRVSNMVELQLNNVNNSKVSFQQFCRDHITDFRLRESVIQGIQTQTDYEEVVKHQENVQKTIFTSMQYAQTTMKTYSDEIEQFIQHIHVHLRKLVEELKNIPRNTRIRVENEFIPMFQFSIPEWSDEEGVQHIRKRIEWIIEQLENDFYKGEDGQEDQMKVRKQVEQWFSSIQLLRVVTQNKEWRVSCRKVTNDHRISKSVESWSRSNAWSGGEKWSKNMALFLGILKYVSEKRQHSPRTKKRSRTVIVDNPFGKASSDHVLSPVFFIAEQLGFQMIALTAHVEGKFLHDYFPIVYSCRLRSAVGSQKQIVHPNKSVHHALFQDHDERAEETIDIEQLSLFN